MTNKELPSFPVDDLALDAVEHALGAYLTFDRPDGADPDDDGPWVEGADYQLDRVLDFYAGTTEGSGYRVGPDLEPISDEQAGIEDALGHSQTWVDERPHYTERDVIRSLIAEVRRLRDAS